MVVLEWCFEIWLFLGYGDEEEPPLLFKRVSHRFAAVMVEILYYISSTREPTITLTYSGGV